MLHKSSLLNMQSQSNCSRAEGTSGKDVWDLAEAMVIKKKIPDGTFP